MQLMIEQIVKEDLYTYLTGKGLMDKKIPECPDIEEKWGPIVESYINDGIREYEGYPEVSLGWMMFIGMAMASFWDEDWVRYKNVPDLYLWIKGARGYDYLDEYVLEDILKLDAQAAARTSDLVSECAARVNSALRHAPVEPGTADAFRAYVGCLHQLYLAGIAVQLKAMGYHMTRL
ncbi:MAG: hypothetical protein ACI3ZL_02065 [Candidatus Cryptobacteroides sp.]